MTIVMRWAARQVPELVAATGLLLGSVAGSLLGELARGAIIGAVAGLSVAMILTRASPESR